ncbi:restriction endonuclease subunit S [Dolichospermum planctonicum UHCC 0167]|uniref:restriction endonuclease subunit S n=1 Tax=Dolichospermum planctonicum TaxID=136072 RepID=UPI0014438AFB|nr:restriction endonuclease subunit S [Dolichospermum planctonicum]MCW9681429.1 restriction endonuclease subunit S [Dolichospermum planctonicum UHCC 0167]
MHNSLSEYWEGGDVPWICLQDIRAADGKIIYETLFKSTMLGIKNSSARLLPEGTVCFSRDISVGFVTIMGRSMATTQHFANWICGSRLFNQYLMYAFIASRSSLIQSGEGTTVRTIYMPALKKMQIILPPLEEQKQIVFLIQKYFKIIETIEKQHQQATEKLEKLNQSILCKAFRGELVPQDPEDEPASVLLERIRAEREKLNNNKPKSTSKRKSKTPKEHRTIPGLE